MVLVPPLYVASDALLKRLLPFFEMVNGYDMVYKWFDHLKTQKHYSTAFVIMPNHPRVILYFPEAGFNLNHKQCKTVYGL